MSSKLSDAQRAMLKKIRASRGKGVETGNTNSTAMALEKRGYIFEMPERVGQPAFVCKWMLTVAGFHALEE